MLFNRREFLFSSAASGLLVPAAYSAANMATGKTKIGLVRSDYTKLTRRASPEADLDYPIVRDMVWKAIEYGAPRAGSLEQKIKPGSWVVIKPNIVAIRPLTWYRKGDITDFRVTQAVFEYVAARSKARRITLAEGGSYRRPSDPAEDNHVLQNGQKVDAYSFDWGPDEFPGWNGSMAQMLDRLGKQFPGRQFDYVDLSYDCVRDAAGKFKRLPVPVASNGVGAFSQLPDYFVTNTIRNCDFLIVVPVMKIHLMCGITICLKSYVGTAPREAYGVPGVFSNQLLHSGHMTDERIDHFIVDLAAFHPPDYCVVDAIRGLQQQEHGNGRTDQMVRSNMVMAGEDPVAMDAFCSKIMGLNPWDIEMCHQAEARLMGTMSLDKVEVIGDDPAKVSRRWEKARRWYGRCNRDWLVTTDPSSDLRTWRKYVSRGDTVDLTETFGPAAAYGLAVRVEAGSHHKGFLWTGLRGKLIATLNGQVVARESSDTAYRVGQFQNPMELKSGENLLMVRVEPIGGQAKLSILFSNHENAGDTIQGVNYSA
jgi:uncharacterized protein (DUF362 family)